SRIVITDIQSQLFSITNSEPLAESTEHVCDLVRRTERPYPATDPILSPEYMIHSPSLSMDPSILYTLDSPEIRYKSRLQRAIHREHIISEIPGISGVIMNNKGEVVYCYRKMQPWISIEPWNPGNGGISVCTMPGG
ncbi:uncharacterized protein BDR25DRAFT_174648, partial [Lindgomyces ingoldianus]